MIDKKDSSARARAESFVSQLGIRLPILLAPMAGACPPSLSITGTATESATCGRRWEWQRRAISTFPKFPQQKFFSVVLTACEGRVTRVVRKRSDRPSLGKHGKRKLDELHGARKDRTASAKFGAVQRHGEALGLDQR